MRKQETSESQTGRGDKKHEISKQESRQANKNRHDEETGSLRKTDRIRRQEA